MRPQVKEILDQLEKFNIIEPCDIPSPFCSNLLVVKKKDGQNIRLLLDARLLNHATVRLPSVLVSRQEVLAHLVDKTHVTTIDLSDAFWNLCLSEKTKPLTAFFSPSHGRRFCFTRLPQGAKNSPAYLKGLLDRVLSGLNDIALAYVDDVLVATKGTLEEHLIQVEKVLSRIHAANLRIRPPKMVIATESVEFLGIQWQINKINIPEAKLSAFKNFPSPKTPKQLKSIICTLSFYRTFVPNFAKLSKNLMELTTLKPKEFKWSEDYEKELRTLIDAICLHNSIHLPDPSLPYYIQTDASKIAGAGKIFQKDPETGEERILACLSRTFTKAERNYSTIKQEVVALLYTMRSFSYFLEFAPHITILVDAKSILYLRLARESSGILLRFSLELSKYDTTIVHVAGKDNIVCDNLSRLHKGAVLLADAEKELPKPLSEKETLQILSRLTIPDGLTFSSSEVKELLEGPSLPSSVLQKAQRKIRTKTGVRYVKTTPEHMPNKKVNLPQTTRHRPGALLPKRPRKYLPTNVTPLLLEDEEQGDIEAADADNPDDPAYETDTSQPMDLTNDPDDNEETNDDSIDSTADDDVPDPENEILEQLLENTPEQEDPDPNDVTYHYAQIPTANYIMRGGIVSIKQFLMAQKTDPYCIAIKAKNPLPANFSIIRGLLFRKTNGTDKPVLPAILLPALINTKHFSVYGNHSTKARIIRDVTHQFFIRSTELNNAIANTISNCYVCQAYSMQHNRQNLRRSDFAKAPRHSWAIDLIASLPETKNGHKIALIACDYFTGYLQAVPLESSSAEALIRVLKNNIIVPFGKPTFFRSDQQVSMAKSRQFMAFLQEYNIELYPTAASAAFSNGLAENGVKAFKHMLRKIAHQEGNVEQWDELLPHLISAHNLSTTTYGFTPDELHFGHRLPQAADLLTFWPTTPEPQEYMDHLIPLVNAKRTEMRRRSDLKNDYSIRSKNQERQEKKFVIGSQVLHRQLQCATGTGSSLNPRFNGIFTVRSINPDKVTAQIENMTTGRIIKAHFDNMHHLTWNPSVIRMSQQSADAINAITKEALDDIPSTEDLLSEIGDESPRHNPWTDDEESDDSSHSEDEPTSEPEPADDPSDYDDPPDDNYPDDNQPGSHSGPADDTVPLNASNEEPEDHSESDTGATSPAPVPASPSLSHTSERSDQDPDYKQPYYHKPRPSSSSSQMVETRKTAARNSQNTDLSQSQPSSMNSNSKNGISKTSDSQSAVESTSLSSTHKGNEIRAATPRPAPLPSCSSNEVSGPLEESPVPDSGIALDLTNSADTNKSTPADSPPPLNQPRRRPRRRYERVNKNTRQDAQRERLRDWWESEAPNRAREPNTRKYERTSQRMTNRPPPPEPHTQNLDDSNANPRPSTSRAAAEINPINSRPDPTLSLPDGNIRQSIVAAKKKQLRFASLLKVCQEPRSSSSDNLSRSEQSTASLPPEQIDSKFRKKLDLRDDNRKTPVIVPSILKRSQNTTKSPVELPNRERSRLIVPSIIRIPPEENEAQVDARTSHNTRRNTRSIRNHIRLEEKLFSQLHDKYGSVEDTPRCPCCDLPEDEAEDLGHPQY